MTLRGKGGQARSITQFLKYSFVLFFFGATPCNAQILHSRNHFWQCLGNMGCPSPLYYAISKGVILGTRTCRACCCTYFKPLPPSWRVGVSRLHTYSPETPVPQPSTHGTTVSTVCNPSSFPACKHQQVLTLNPQPSWASRPLELCLEFNSETPEICSPGSITGVVCSVKAFIFGQENSNHSDMHKT